MKYSKTHPERRNNLISGYNCDLTFRMQ